MNPEPFPIAARVLMVGPASTIAEIGRNPGSGIEIETSPDVYRALAKLLRENDGAFVGVVVSLDCVGPRELGFFSTVARARRGLKVLVHSVQGEDGRIARALEAGAGGVFSAQSWSEFSPPPPPQVTQTPIEETVESNPPVAELMMEAAESEVPPIDEEAPLDEVSDETPSPARVPWLRYAESPHRAAPPVRQPPPPVAPHPAPSPPPSTRDYEPLLTDEELEALLADDISAIAPKPNPSWRRPEGGRP